MRYKYNQREIMPVNKQPAKMLHLIQLFCVISFIFASIVKGVEFDEVLVYRSRSGDELGKVRGSVMKTRLGREFRAFRGIPYAKPPINSLRFKV